MTTPARLRLSRQKGEDLQLRSKLLNGLECVPVGRPSRYGNPHRIDVHPLGPNITQDDAVRLFEDSLERMDPTRRETYLAPLRGQNLACWCALDAPCHADVLLKWANAPKREEQSPLLNQLQDTIEKSKMMATKAQAEFEANFSLHSKTEPTERDNHYDRDGYCDNPARGY